jgi:hypothetical protein
MLGHLVLGREGTKLQPHPVAPREAGWMTRLLRALRRLRA